jgi:hypothetical protein
MWVVELHTAFLDELLRLDRSVRIAIFANIGLLEAYGPRLGRPQVDTLAGSKYRNMKEMRITVASGEWRVAFAFEEGSDPARCREQVRGESVVVLQTFDPRCGPAIWRAPEEP